MSLWEQFLIKHHRNISKEMVNMKVKLIDTDNMLKVQPKSRKENQHDDTM